MDYTNQNFSCRDMLLRFREFQVPLSTLLKGKNCYVSFLKKLLKHEYMSMSRSSLVPTIKELCASNRVGKATIRGYIYGVHYALERILEKEFVKINVVQIEYFFCFDTGDRKFRIQFEEMPSTPKVGDTVTFPAFESELEHQYYCVERIIHEYVEHRQVIHVCLTGVGQDVDFESRKVAEVLNEESLVSE